MSTKAYMCAQDCNCVQKMCMTDTLGQLSLLHVPVVANCFCSIYICKNAVTFANNLPSNYLYLLGIKYFRKIQKQGRNP